MILPEIVAAGIFNSNILRPNISISKNRKTSMFEIEIPITKGGISYIDNDSGQIAENMIICAKPDQIRHTKFPFECYYVHMIINDGLIYDILSNAPNYFETDKKDEYTDIFKSIINHYNAFSDKEDLLLQSKILELIYLMDKDINKFTKNSESAKGDASVIQKALKFVENHLTDDLSLEAVARVCTLSPIHFHNVFKTATGKTLHTYVEEMRIKKAINLLLTTNYTLTKIAYECGFSSQSYFSFAFKRKMKCTPREYIKDTYSRYEI